MTLSYIETKATPRVRPAPRGLPKTLKGLGVSRRDLAAAYAEVTASPIFRPALLRVASALTLGFCLVNVAKAFVN